MGQPAGTTKGNATEAVRRTYAEHELLAQAQRNLEGALTTTGTLRQTAWAETVVTRLVDLRDALQDHIDSAESNGGLLSEMERRMIAINDQVVYVLKDHKRLVDECQSLIVKVGGYAAKGKVPLGELRKNAASLLANIRKHRSREISLIREVFPR
jgi:hypothetical protein